MVDRQLEDLSFLQFCRSLFLESGRDETSQFGQTVIDAVPTPLLDDPAPSLSCHVATGSGRTARFVKSFAR